jgi:hypothetical protein
MTALQDCIFEEQDWANVARLAHQIETMALKRAKKALDEVDEMDGADK